MRKLKFKVGDILTVTDPKDPSHFKRFQEVIGILPVEDGSIPYSMKSIQNGRILGPQVLNPFFEDTMRADKRGEYLFRSIETDNSSLQAYFESVYRALDEQEKMMYINE